LTSTLTRYARSTLLLNLVSDITANGGYYVCYSQYMGWPDELNPPTAIDSVDSYNKNWEQMIYAKKVQPTDVSILLDNTPWTTNTVYTSYDHRTTEQGDYVITDQRNVYKCLFNANGVPSTSKPTVTANVPFTSADGYVWKYMFTPDQASIDKFGDLTYIPYVANSTITSQAQPGTIDIVLVEQSGNNWGAVHSGVVQSVVSPTVMQISSNAVSTNSYYDQSAFYVQSGNGAGFLSQISSYVSNTQGNYVVLNDGSNAASFGSSYYISPYVSIVGDGSGARAYSTVNTTLGVITGVTVINSGSGYTWANAAFSAGLLTSNTMAVVTPMIAPPGGHGFDPVNELGAHVIKVVVQTSNTDSIPANVSFRTTSIIASPNQANGSPATANAYSVYYTANVTLSISTPTPPTPTERVTGQSSSATATVILANTTSFLMGDMRGTFVPGEAIISNTSSTIAVLSSINTPQLQKYTGSVFYLNNFQVITRTTVSKEMIKIIIGT